ncbi:MAG: GAF domain-containing protein [Verrucomicrobiae bacterium]|nr:GAF domain-containing protein [Verrucomicrobiae bacterium]
MRITCRTGEEEWSQEFPTDVVVIGRPSKDFTPDLDLSCDPAVSRRHAQVRLKGRQLWVEDMGSTCGTMLNGVRIQKEAAFNPGDVLQLGATELVVALTPDPAKHQAAEESWAISTVLNASESLRSPPGGGRDGFQKQFSLLLELPLRFAAETQVEPLLQLVVESMVQLVPGAERGVLLLHDPKGDRLTLKAHHPPGSASSSETLARRAMQNRQGLIWNRADNIQDITASLNRLAVQSGIYAPLIWKDEVIGVLCVDSATKSRPFQEDDLRFVLSIAHYAASAIANRRLQEQLQSKSTVLERLLTQFSPKLRTVLLDKAAAGSLRPGGDKSEVTVLMSDIRGFTEMASKMDPHDVVELLNDYFPALSEAIFCNDGTIDKFVGDAILAVFGSPEADPNQHEKAVRAALAMQEAAARVSARRKEAGEVRCQIGIGVHSGTVLHGFIGTSKRLEFTVIGDAVNKVARYCDAAQPGEILISPAVLEHTYRFVEVEKAVVETKHKERLDAYRVLKLIR